MNRDHTLSLLAHVLDDPSSHAIVLCSVFDGDDDDDGALGFGLGFGFEMRGLWLEGPVRPTPDALYARAEEMLDDGALAVVLGSFGPDGVMLDVVVFRLRCDVARLALDDELARAAGFRLVAGGSA